MPRAAVTPRLSFVLAVPADARTVAAILTAASDALTARFGRGHWSHATSERGVLATMKRGGDVWIARRGRTPVGTWTLATRKPWAIDRAYFDASSARPRYLTGMAVRPESQGLGIGRRCLEHAAVACRAAGGDAIRLDAYDAVAGAGEFYARCGYREVGRVTYRKVPLVYYELLLGRDDAGDGGDGGA